MFHYFISTVAKVEMMKVNSHFSGAATRGVLKEKVCQSLLVVKLQVSGLRPANSLKKRLWHRRFPVNFAKLLRKPFLPEHLWATASDLTSEVDSK